MFVLEKREKLLGSWDPENVVKLAFRVKAKMVAFQLIDHFQCLGSGIAETPVDAEKKELSTNPPQGVKSTLLVTYCGKVDQYLKQSPLGTKDGMGSECFVLLTFTYGGHDSDGEQQRLGEGPGVVPIVGGVVVVVGVVVHDELCQDAQITLDLQLQIMRLECRFGSGSRVQLCFASVALVFQISD